MTKEGNSYANPLRLRTGDGNLSYEKGKRAFDNQVKGKYVDDPITGTTYVCTGYKTINKEPVWAVVDPTSLKATTTYKILINAGKSGDKPTTDAGNKTVTYTSAVVLKRLNRGKKYNLKSWGSFIFISITDSDLKYIKGDTTAVAESTTTVASTGADTVLVAAVTNAPAEVASAYTWLGVNSFFGRPLVPLGTVAPGGGGQSHMNYAQTMAAYAGYANYRTAAQMAADAAAAKKAAAAKNPSAPLAPKGLLPAAAETTAVLNFLPDRRIGGQNTNLPYIQQTVTDFNSVTNTRERIIRTHVFNIIPNSFEFSQLASVWNEVERSGNYAMVDWSKYNLTKCTFRFLVAGKRTDVIDAGTTTAKSTIVNDGLDVSIDEQIENLRAMGGGPYPVVLHNLNTLTATSFRFPYVNNTRNLQWVIADMSITATRMTPNGRKMAAAEVSITLNEYPIIARDIIALPPLTPDIPVPKICKPKPCKPVEPKNGLMTTSHWRAPIKIGTE